MNYNFKTTLLTLSTLALVACNGGGGGSNSGGNTPNPEPSPTTTPAVVIQPLEVTQNIIPSLNKIGSHQVWYMVVKNPNTVKIGLLPTSPDIVFEYVASNESTPINPTKYAMKYDKAISGIETDCLDIINNGNTTNPKNQLAAGQSCAYKFDAQWGGNITPETNFKFTMKYAFVIGCNDQGICTAAYSNAPDCDSNKYTCLPNNQDLQFNLMKLSNHKANDLFGMTAMTNDGGGWQSIISMDGSTYWDASAAPLTNVYKINYNSSTNTFTKILTNTYTSDYIGGAFSAVSTNGDNYYGFGYTQTGEMTTINNMAQDWKWTYGLNGNIYGSSPWVVTVSGFAYLLNQNGTNSTLTQLPAAIGTQILYGVNTNGSLWTFSYVNGVYSMYCYDATNNYAKTTMNLNGLNMSNFNRMTSRDAYYVSGNNKTDYYDIKYPSFPVTNIVAYKVNFNNCSLDKTNYVLSLASLPNYQYGIVGYNYNAYIESVNQFSNGLNGGN